ncbi:aminomethyl-transferring glycine dehydrogenase subunit GcvPA [Macrococcus equipercicus]|uniref:Probable glycine dehydrogenase (decarboxylating) subunit 1 n=1 Tax=Macrococcus equipercicus TaxID=69967 RepID=A0A9Q9BS57_9STAP|nr:aminomethyl-transferring glycine dehydrogenase subunit GcvPA [Macrococcus equipercicus]KAA1040116.1 aminomethyl-transferring glycine dehydrogenase subunit GcvPA [Macrococcus equipercicus]UTH12936.1 aminomethyl-transferring glycine dehydrogenase subunit GcvPA [Macrococcus equipercicus]
MSHRYIPLTETDKQDMMKTIGIQSIDELFADIPEKVRFDRPLNIKERKAETPLLRELGQIAAKNMTSDTHVSFLGAGVYDHYIPTVVDHVISRSEFYTAYTPYQPEISQGELQAIFEFQTMIAELTGMDVANSSMYDGGTSFAEAAMLACGHTKKKKILVSKAVNNESREVLHMYAKGQNLEVVEIDLKDTVTDLDKLKAAVDADTACIMVQYPNFFGSIEDLEAIKAMTAGTKALFIVSSNPMALGLLTPPGEFGADIVVGDAQVFGIPAQFGGPHCGYFAATKALMRKMPGRLVGQTQDDEGQRGFVLTLQAREQHIRRDKATSNICSNQALNALAASVAMSALGKNGVYEMAQQNLYKTNYMKDKMTQEGFTVLPGTSFNEFVVKFNQPVADINDKLLTDGFIGGFDLGRVDAAFNNHMLIAVTELRTKEEIDTFIAKVGVYNA